MTLQPIISNPVSLRNHKVLPKLIGVSHYACTQTEHWEAHYACTQTDPWEAHYACTQTEPWEAHYACTQTEPWEAVQSVCLTMHAPRQDRALHGKLSSLFQFRLVDTDYKT